ncbi:hypothetical protein ACXPWS_12840 [Mycobacterium sp. BMJ-28]
MTMTEADQRHLSTAIHESAHSVISACYGAQIETAEVLRGGPKTTRESVAGFTRYAPFDEITRLYFPAIAAAGSAGEAIFAKGKPTLTEVWQLLASKNTHDLDQMSMSLVGHRQNPFAVVQQVLPMVDRLWRPIAELGWSMYRDGPITHRAVLDVLGIPSLAEQPRYAAAIRAGAEPGELSVGRQLF